MHELGVVFHMRDLLEEVAAEQGYIKPEDKEKLIKFRNNPSDESWIGAE